MNKQLLVWKSIAQCLLQHTPVMLLYVLQSSGSSPGRQGFFMAINANNEMEGSIGGGIMEHKFVEMAKKRLKGQEYWELEIRKQLHDKSAAKNQSGMICSGEQTILLYGMQQSDLEAIQNIITSLEQNKNGTLHLSPAGINFSSTAAEKDFHFVIRSEEDWEYAEKTGYKNQLFIIGGGHCSLAFSKLMRSLDFYIRVYDDRPGLKTMQENHFAHECLKIHDFSLLKDIIPSWQNQYVVIMTFGYRSDDLAVRALVNNEFKYFGILGSKTKIKKMLDKYRSEGIDPAWLQRINAPAGLHIKSQTPEEIAVSIAAEIIKIKNQYL